MIQKHRLHGDLISLILFFQNNESRLKIKQINRVKMNRYSYSKKETRKHGRRQTSKHVRKNYFLLYLRFPQRWLWRMPSSGMWRRVVPVKWSDVSEERIASIFRVEKSASEEPAWAGSSRLLPHPRRRHSSYSCWFVTCSEKGTWSRVLFFQRNFQKIASSSTHMSTCFKTEAQ
jgi:hypothetical protein